MSRKYLLPLFFVIGQMAILDGDATAAVYPRPCVSLADIADGSLHTNSLFALEAKDGSYRVNETLNDPVLGQKWAIVTSCERPEAPPFAISTNETIGNKPYARESKGAAVVHAGDIVRLWKQEANLRIQMAARSEESGELGKTIRVRLIGGDSAEHQFVGIVRGVGDVEINR
jgi:hypothetical protein